MLSGQALVSSGTSAVLAGVNGSVGDWHDHWFDDGDLFFPQGNAVGLAHLGDPSQPALVWGNGGRTVASFVLDEAGDSLLSSDGAIRLWKNLIELVTSPEASCSFRAGTLGLDPADFDCTSAPVVGSAWTSTIATAPLVGTTTLSTILALGLGGPVHGSTAFGYEVLALPPYVMDVGQGAHQMAIPSSPGLVGLSVTAQGARVELGHGKLSLVLTNAQDLLLGF